MIIELCACCNKPLTTKIIKAWHGLLLCSNACIVQLANGDTKALEDAEDIMTSDIGITTKPGV
jgi:hypothetical protein